MPKQSSNKPPELLQNVQAWFSKLRFAPDAEAQQAWMNEASAFVTASATMSARERLEVYVQDYWPRCLDSLSEDFPYLKKIMGDTLFSHWMVRYLENRPSQSYTLYHLPEGLADFLYQHYHEANREMVLQLQRFEWMVAQSWFLPHKTAFSTHQLTESERQHLAQRRFEWQPHVFLECFMFRFSALIKSDKSQKPRKGQDYVMIYRYNGSVEVESISYVQYQLFLGIKRRLPLSAAIELASTGISEREMKKIETALPSWITQAIEKALLI